MPQTLTQHLQLALAHSRSDDDDDEALVAHVTDIGVWMLAPVVPALWRSGCNGVGVRRDSIVGGHSNTRQKIQYLTQLKRENAELRRKLAATKRCDDGPRVRSLCAVASTLRTVCAVCRRLPVQALRTLVAQQGTRPAEVLPL